MKVTLTININEPNQADGYQIVQFNGEFDKDGHNAIKEQLEKCIEDFSLKSLIFDFTTMKFINSEGIGYLMEVHSHLVKRGHQLVIVGANDHVLDVFQTIGLLEIVPVRKSLESFLSNN